MAFCDYNGVVLSCGIFVSRGNRCELHKEKTQKEVRKKGLKFSGHSKQREEEGYKTSGIGR